MLQDPSGLWPNLDSSNKIALIHWPRLEGLPLFLRRGRSPAALLPCLWRTLAGVQVEVIHMRSEGIVHQHGRNALLSKKNKPLGLHITGPRLRSNKIPLKKKEKKENTVCQWLAHCPHASSRFKHVTPPEPQETPLHVPRPCPPRPRRRTLCWPRGC